MSKRDEAMLGIEKDLIKLKGALASERRSNGVLPVIGEGSHKAKILFVGEAPGKKEALTGKPFCGASGKFLDTLLDSISLKRKDTYITSIVKDRPTDNRDPKEEEIKEYAPLMDRQMEVIRPKVIVTLGRISMAYILNKFELGDKLQPISKIHGKVFRAKAPWGNISIIPLYHPAVALYNGGSRSTLLKDFRVLKGMI